MKVKNIVFSGFMAMVLAGACGAANAEIIVASQKYVDDKVTTLNTKDTELADKVTALENANADGGSVATAIAAAQTAADNAQSDVNDLAGKMNLTVPTSDLSTALAAKEDTANKLVSGDIDLLKADGKVNTDAVNALVGEDTKFPTVGAAVEIANAKAQEVLENVSAVSADLGGLTTKVAEHTASIQKLEGGDDVTGSVANAIKQSKAYADSLAGNYDAKGSAATAESNANAYTDQKVAAEKSRAELAEQANAQAILDAKTELQGYADTAESDAVTTANAYTDSKVSTLTSQTADNTGAIAQLRTDVNAAGTAIDNIAKEGGTIDQKVSELETKLMDDTNGTVTAAIKAEADRAKGEEARIEGLVTAEANRADAAEKANAQAIADEKSRAEGVEAGLQTAIDTINDDTNGIFAKAKAYTETAMAKFYANAQECIAESDSHHCIMSAHADASGNPVYVWIDLTAPAE